MLYDLQGLGLRVREARQGRGFTSRELAERSGVSTRFLSELENGRGNISVLRLAAISHALGVSPARLIDGAPGQASEAQWAAVERLLAAGSEELGELLEALESVKARGGVGRKIYALLGVRGSGKSTVGAQAALALGVDFVELDALVEAEAGLSLAEIFAIHGEAYYKELELRVLERFLSLSGDAVLATGGSIVSHPEAWSRLARHTTTVWLQAEAKALWERVVAQGDSRPMDSNPNAFAQLEALVAARAPLYGRAHAAIETTDTPLTQIVGALVALNASGPGAGRP